MKLKIIKIIFCLSVVLVLTGCGINFKTTYKLTDTFEKIHFERKGNKYTMDFVDHNYYTFFFSDNNYNENYFSMKDKEKNIVKYNLVAQKVTYNSCSYNKKENIYDNCQEEEMKKIKHCLEVYDVFLEQLKLRPDDLYITAKELDEKYINIENR